MKNRFVGVALGCLLGVGSRSALAAWHPEPVKTLGESAAELSSVETKLKSEPSNLSLLSKHADLMGALGRYEEEIKEAKAITQKDPKLPYAYVLQAHGYGKLKQYTDAVSALDKSFSLEKPTPDLLLLKATFLRRLKKYPDAVTLLDQVIKTQPTNYVAYDCRAQCFLRMKGICPEALHDLETVVRLNPSDTGSANLLDQLHKEAKGQTAH